MESGHEVRRGSAGTGEGKRMVCALFSKAEWKRDRTEKPPSRARGGWELLTAHGGLTVPPPQHDPSWSPGRQYLHGAQGQQLHKGVCSYLVDLVVLETPGETETGLRTELKAAFPRYGDLCPSAALSQWKLLCLGDLLLFQELNRMSSKTCQSHFLLQAVPGLRQPLLLMPS